MSHALTLTSSLLDIALAFNSGLNDHSIDCKRFWERRADFIHELYGKKKLAWNVIWRRTCNEKAEKKLPDHYASFAAVRDRIIGQAKGHLQARGARGSASHKRPHRKAGPVVARAHTDDDNDDYNEPQHAAIDEAAASMDDNADTKTSTVASAVEPVAARSIQYRRRIVPFADEVRNAAEDATAAHVSEALTNARVKSQAITTSTTAVTTPPMQTDTFEADDDGDDDHYENKYDVGEDVQIESALINPNVSDMKLLNIGEHGELPSFLVKYFDKYVVRRHAVFGDAHCSISSVMRATDTITEAESMEVRAQYIKRAGILYTIMRNKIMT
jgi:hypothetical protein